MGDSESKQRERHPILVPVDFSDDAAAALLWAARLARAWRAPLLVLHVVHDPESAPGYYQRSKKHKKHLRRIEEAAAEMMDDFLAQMRSRHGDELPELDHRLVVGLPVTRILEVAEVSAAQQIVMGSQGRTGLDRLLLGSKAEKVVRLAPVPVTIVKADPETGGEAGS
ncbi:MAG: universal stress protein [Acidobacteriota bacterium]